MTHHSLLRRATRTAPAALGALAAFLWLVPGETRAESALRLAPPPVFGEIGAATYDEDGRRVGPASMRIERLHDGQVRIVASSAIDGAERTVVTALLAPAGEGGVLQPLRQESRSFDAAGAPLGLMTIDHEHGWASCASAQRSEEPDRVDLPSEERVANVLLNLLFQPLIRGGKERLDFQIFVCRGGARVMNGEATVAGPHSDARAGRQQLIEVRYGVSLGPLLTRIARPFLPRLSSWFDPAAPDAWVGHSMPLFANGPTVLVVRSGVSPALLQRTP